MQQAIVGFHLDEENHWVAELACGMVSMCGIIHLGKTVLGS
jgi:Protein of unknown function (DUF3565).